MSYHHTYADLIGKFDYVYRGFWKEYGAKSVDHLPLVSEGMYLPVIKHTLF